MLAYIFAKVSTTPFGFPVVPDVYTINAMSVSSRATPHSSGLDILFPKFASKNISSKTSISGLFASPLAASKAVW